MLFLRFIGLFLLSPLFSGKGIPRSVRIALAIACGLILAPPLSALHTFSFAKSSEFWIEAAGQLLIGYLIGFLFALLFEAAAFAGQLIGTAMGFSATELLDPFFSSSYPMMGRLFSLIALALFFALDLHHELLRFLYETFRPLPQLNREIGPVIIQGITLLFQQALAFAALPLTLLLSIIALFAVISRFFPIFWVGFPLQLLAGIVAIASTLFLFIPLVEKGFYAFSGLFQNLFVNF